MVRVRVHEEGSMTVDVEVEDCYLEANGEPIGRFDAGEVLVKLGPKAVADRQVTAGDEVQTGDTRA